MRRPAASPRRSATLLVNGGSSTNFNVQGASAEVSYDRILPHGWVASPYAGLRYTKASLSGYTEQSSSVTDPLSYGSLSTETTTALAGVRFLGHLNGKIMANASIGVEQDLANAGGSASVTNTTIGALNARACPEFCVNGADIKFLRCALRTRW